MEIGLPRGILGKDTSVGMCANAVKPHVIMRVLAAGRARRRAPVGFLSSLHAQSGFTDGRVRQNEIVFHEFILTLLGRQFYVFSCVYFPCFIALASLGKPLFTSERAFPFPVTHAFGLPMTSF